jgi:hypothetical protein
VQPRDIESDRQGSTLLGSAVVSYGDTQSKARALLFFGCDLREFVPR